MPSNWKVGDGEPHSMENIIHLFFDIVGEDFLPFSTSVDWDAMKILLSEALIE